MSSTRILFAMFLMLVTVNVNDAFHFPVMLTPAAIHNARLSPKPPSLTRLFLSLRLGSPLGRNPAPGLRLKDSSSAVVEEDVATNQTVVGTNQTVLGNDAYADDGIMPRCIDRSKLGKLRFIYPEGCTPLTPPEKSTKPLLLFVPGIDGVGVFASSQWQDLARNFELRVMQVPADDRLDFAGMVSAVQEVLSSWKASGGQGSLSKPVLIGESFGALTCLGMAQQFPDLVQGMVLVNPATSYRNTSWAVVGRFFASVPQRVPLGGERLVDVFERVGIKQIAKDLNLMPDIGLGDIAYAGAVGPIMASLALDRHTLSKFGLMARDFARDWIQAAVGGNGPEKTLELARQAIDALEYLLSTLPPETVKHRLENLMEPGCDSVLARMGDVQCPVIAVVGENDFVLPSNREGDELKKVLKQCSTVKVKGAGHILLDERVNITKLILDSPLATRGQRRDPVLSFERPSKLAMRNASEGLDVIRRLGSPIFFSTNPDTKQVELGLRHLPRPVDGRPVLFVGNHQLCALDLGPLLEGVYEQTGMLMRGLAHPSLFNRDVGSVPGMMSGQGIGGENVYEIFGAVPVTAMNAHKLLAAGEPVLLFPGGMAEALHGKGQYYKLQWPDKPDFVRLAAKFNAIIVPFGGVGASESISILADSSEIEEFAQTPLGKALSSLLPASAPRAGNFGTEGLNADRLSRVNVPLISPKAPWDMKRFYFLFGAPIFTEGDVEVAELYKESRQAVESCIAFLETNRVQDPYADFQKRLLYETRTARQAPTFLPPTTES